MGRNVKHLGALSGADMSISPDGRNFTWFTSDLPDPIQVYVECSDETRGRTPFVGGRGGAQTITWIIPGRVCTFTLDAAGKTVLSLVVDSREGFPVKTSIIRAGAPAPPIGAPTWAPAPAAAPTPTAPSMAPPPEPSWTETIAPGGTLLGLPYIYVLGGIGILAIAAFSPKKRR